MKSQSSNHSKEYLEFMESDTVRDAMVDLIQAINESEILQGWLENLGQLSEQNRSLAVAGIVQTLEESGEPEHRVAAFKMLVSRNFYDKVRLVLKEIRTNTGEI